MVKQAKNKTVDTAQVEANNARDEQQSATHDTSVPSHDATSAAPSDLAHLAKPGIHRASRIQAEYLPTEELIDGRPLPDASEFERGTD